MMTLSDIERKKQLLKLPAKRNQVEYWGPVTHVFADSFLTMSHKFIYQYFIMIDSKRLKAIFSSFVEMVQNVSEYNEKTYDDNYPQSYLQLKDQEGAVMINTINCIEQKDLLSIKAIFENLFEIAEEDLKSEFKSKLLSNGSLGLIMLRKLPNAKFDYNIAEDENGKIWLSQELKVNYGNT